jgi:hypothetical protein
VFEIFTDSKYLSLKLRKATTAAVCDATTATQNYKSRPTNNKKGLEACKAANPKNLKI